MRRQLPDAVKRLSAVRLLRTLRQQRQRNGGWGALPGLPPFPVCPRSPGEALLCRFDLRIFDENGQLQTRFCNQRPVIWGVFPIY